eukprot:330414-Amphidinium_carterae.1
MEDMNQVESMAVDESQEFDMQPWSVAFAESFRYGGAVMLLATVLRSGQVGNVSDGLVNERQRQGQGWKRGGQREVLASRSRATPLGTGACSSHSIEKFHSCSKQVLAGDAVSNALNLCSARVLGLGGHAKELSGICLNV